MNKVLISMFALLPTLALAQDYVMYETQYLTVMPGHAKPFNDGMKAHNEKFHASGPSVAAVWLVPNGPRSGQIFWAMGPCTFTDLDNRPASAEHESDWTDNVLAHASSGEAEYWRMDGELSLNPRDDVPPLIRVRIFDIEEGQHDRFEAEQRKIKEVLVAKNRKVSRSVFRTAVASGTGRDYAVVTAYENWAALDTVGSNFAADYEDVHGAGSFSSFVRDRQTFVKHMEDEFHELIPELSASPTSSNE